MEPWGLFAPHFALLVRMEQVWKAQVSKGEERVARLVLKATVYLEVEVQQAGLAEGVVLTVEVKSVKQADSGISWAEVEQVMYSSCDWEVAFVGRVSWAALLPHEVEA
mmetsp:Transcript_4693/g.6648  ORF Transcript_4693/g.6648 Transcript_4693/m.6648 type:complete len:108 (-) Transcript_4693:258-581(-)